MKIILLILGILLLARHFRGWYVSRVEYPAMNIESTNENIKIVQMPKQIIATVRTRGTLAGAPRQAFGLLAGYIFGDNTATDKIAMTAPVTSKIIEGQKIEMTAPVVAKEIQSGVVETSFTMPSKWTLETLPIPNNDAVSLGEISSSKKAVWTFNGYAEQERVDGQRNLFQQALTNQNIQRSGSPTLAQYNDPLTPPWMRRNELRVDTE